MPRALEVTFGIHNPETLGIYLNSSCYAKYRYTLI